MFTEPLLSILEASFRRLLSCRVVCSAYKRFAVVTNIAIEVQTLIHSSL